MKSFHPFLILLNLPIFLKSVSASNSTGSGNEENEKFRANSVGSVSLVIDENVSKAVTSVENQLNWRKVKNPEQEPEYFKLDVHSESASEQKLIVNSKQKSTEAVPRGQNKLLLLFTSFLVVLISLLLAVFHK